MTARVALTYRDYVALPDDGQRHEIHDGELCVTPAPSCLHQIVLVRLAAALETHVSARRLGVVMVAPLDVILSDRPGETTILQPDIVYVDGSRQVEILRMRGVEGAPTLVVELLSPRTALIDRTTKRDLYARYGVPHFWIVDVDARAIEAYSLRGGDYAQVARVSGTRPVDLPPFRELRLVPAGLWPEQVPPA